jgi:hypothetical protein
MKTRLIAITALALAIALPTALNAQETDPLSVVEAWAQAMNAYDIEAALSLLTDDAFIKLVPPPMEGHDGVFRGKEEIRAWWERLYGLNSVGEVSDCQVDGETVTCMLTYTDDELKSIGIDSIDNEFLVVVQDGKLQTYTATMTSESTEEIQAAMALLAETGGVNPARMLPLWLGVGGLLLLALGAGVRWTFTRAR